MGGSKKKKKKQKKKKQTNKQTKKKNKQKKNKTKQKKRFLTRMVLFGVGETVVNKSKLTQIEYYNISKLTQQFPEN
jgi:hypothetical protein